MSYAKEELQKYVNMAEQNWYTIIEKTPTFLHFNTSMKTRTYEIVECLTEVLTALYPEQKSCVMKCGCEQQITYYLKFEKDKKIARFSCELKKNEDTLKFMDYQKESNVDIADLTKIRKMFKEFVEELPEYRLRLLTGDLKIKKSK